jgi:hypothetical protein
MLSPMHPTDAKEPTDNMLIKEPTDPKDKHEATENPAMTEATHARHAIEFALTTDMMPNNDL